MTPAGPARPALGAGTPGGAVPAGGGGGNCGPATPTPLAARARDDSGPVSRAARGSLPPAVRPRAEATGPGVDGTGRERFGSPGKPVTGVRRGPPEAAGVSPSRSPGLCVCVCARDRSAALPEGPRVDCCSAPGRRSWGTALARGLKFEDLSFHQISPLHDFGLMALLAQT